MNHKITVKGRPEPTECAPDQPMLDALLRAGVWMPNSCNQGTCGTCKLKVLGGEVDHQNSPEDILLPKEREEGYALACQATPCSDLEVQSDADDDGPVHFPLVDFTATVTAIEDIAQDTRRIRLLPDEYFEFGAGQSVSLQVPGHPDHQRQYSIASCPDDPELELQIRREPGGLASDWWTFESAHMGERVNLSGPLGDFTYLPDDTESPLLLLGGGTGIAPLKSIVLAALADNPDREVWVYHGVRTRAHLYDLDFWSTLVAEHRGVHFRPSVSREEYDGCKGYVTERMLEDIPSCRGWTGYICGSDAFVDGVSAAAKRRRLAPRKTYRERFTPVRSTVSA